MKKLLQRTRYITLKGWRNSKSIVNNHENSECHQLMDPDPYLYNIQIRIQKSQKRTVPDFVTNDWNTSISVLHPKAWYGFQKMNIFPIVYLWIQSFLFFGLRQCLHFPHAGAGQYLHVLSLQRRRLFLPPGDLKWLNIFILFHINLYGNKH